MATVHDELADVIATQINKQFKDIKAVHFLDGSNIAPTDVTEWVSTGSTLLDLAISNRKNGGVPVGRIVELTGLEASGKSLIGAHILAETQRKGGIAVYIDTENAVAREFMEAVGVNLSKMLYIELEAAEDIFATIEEIVTKVRESDKDRLVTILVDSMAGASTKSEIAGDFDKEGWATDKAIIISRALRKITQMIGKQRILLIFTNQLRVRLGVSFGDPYTTSGGKALGFHASVRVRLTSIKKLKDTAADEIVGIRAKAVVSKNRVGPPFRQAEFDIYFDRGIQDKNSWFEFLKKKKLIAGKGWYTLKYNNKELKFQQKGFEELLNTTDGLSDYIYKLICDSMILTYQNNVERDAENVIVENDAVED